MKTSGRLVLIFLLFSGGTVASDDATVSLGNTQSQNGSWALRILAIDGQPVPATAVASHQRVYKLSPGRHTLRLGRWESGTGTRVSGSAQKAGGIRELDVTLAAGGHYRVEGTGRGSSWEPELLSD